MTKKKTKKNSKAKKKDIQVVDAIIEEGVAMVPLEVEKKENRTLFWFFVVVGIVFAMVLVPYFWAESNKSFVFSGVDWVVEDYEGLEIFHGRFLALTNPNLHYNIFLRTDPRKNDVSVSGKLDDFKYGGVISFSPEVDACRGDLSRVMLDLGAFLNRGVGVGPVESGSTDEEVANSTGRRFANCENIMDRTVIVVELGDSQIVKSEINPNCYIVTAENCEDSAVVEKFMVKAVEDFRIKLAEA